MIEIHQIKDRIVEYEDNQEVRDKVFERVVAFFFKEDVFSGEGVMQSDNPQINAPVVMADIADDIIKFKVRRKE